MEKHSASSMPAAAGAIREERKFLLRSDRLRAARILGNVERQNTRVVRAAALFHTVGQDRCDELLGIMSLPACKQVLQPFVVKSLICVASGGGEPSCKPAGRHEQVTRRTVPPRFR